MAVLYNNIVALSWPAVSNTFWADLQVPSDPDHPLSDREVFLKNPLPSLGYFARSVTITSNSDNSGSIFSITGLDYLGREISIPIIGPAANATVRTPVSGVPAYTTFIRKLISVESSQPIVGNISVGIGPGGVTTPILNPYQSLVVRTGAQVEMTTPHRLDALGTLDDISGNPDIQSGVREPDWFGGATPNSMANVTTSRYCDASADLFNYLIIQVTDDALNINEFRMTVGFSNQGA